VRDTKESRLLLALLVAVAFALITVDIRGGQESPVDGARRAAATVFGPVENGVASAVDPIGNAIGAVRDSGERHSRIARLERENAELKVRLGSDDRNRNRVRELDDLLRTAGAGQYGIKAAEVIAIGAAQGFSWTVTIDAGSHDGIRRDMTVINGDGLVGRVTTVGPSTSTVLLANDPDFTVGTRIESAPTSWASPPARASARSPCSSSTARRRCGPATGSSPSVRRRTGRSSPASRSARSSASTRPAAT
jgi:rod shape-determining protein MreC